MQLIDGKAISAQIKQEIAQEVEQICAAGGKRPHLAAILVGHDGGSETYVAHKVKACEQCGFKSSLIRYEEDVTEEELLAKVDELNRDEDVDGFIVQLPLPRHISEQKVIEAIDYRKDVDGFHPINVGRMSIGLPCFVSATPAGIMELFARYHIETKGKHCVVLGRSNIVGKPVATLMMQKTYPGNATVTVCHSATPNLKEICRTADIIIAAMGSPNFVTADGERGCCGDRRRHHAPAFDRHQERLEADGRCEVRRGIAALFLYHPCPRWRRAYDHRVADAQHTVGRQERDL